MFLFSVFLQVILGTVEDEASALYFGNTQWKEGIGPDTRDQYLRTLIRNTYNYHMNEIFATVQNEYIDWTIQGPLEAEPPIRPRHLQMSASRAITDKLYLAPLLRTANWCNQSAFPTYFYIYAFCENVAMVSLHTLSPKSQNQRIFTLKYPNNWFSFGSLYQCTTLKTCWKPFGFGCRQ